ncbi:MFS transporter [Rhizobium sp. Root1204]|uniref:MFS transporter n=1 Tax=Rhizobium sp. Root1204 TaxID=1736428 RepID=UPI000714A058|nr:MFS transporter [Rhizobium sp. Root1204]KQV41208.1 hypothetical protein ASC96_18025 [Rhizobium sp. Root1204]
MPNLSSSGERIALYTALTSLSAISIDTVLPALRSIETDLGSGTYFSPPHIVSLFVVGMIFGELLFGPVADRLGRRKAMLIGLGIFIVGTLLGAIASSLEEVVLARIIQGIGASGPKIACRATIRDQFAGDQMARVMSLIFGLMVVIPMFGPAVGQFLMSFWNWRAIFVMYAVAAIALGAWAALRQPETLPPNQEVDSHPRTVLVNIGKIIKNGRVMSMTVAIGLIFGAELVYLSTAADLFFEVYGIEKLFPVYFAGLALGIGIACFINGMLVERFGMESITRIALSLFSLFSLLLLAASVFYDGAPPLWMYFSILLVAFFCLGLLFGNMGALAMASLGNIAGLGSSIVSSGSGVVAVAYALVIGMLRQSPLTALAIALAIAGVASLLLVEFALRADAQPLSPANRKCLAC